MTDEPFPPAHLRYLARRLQSAGSSRVDRDWTGNDDSSRNHHGQVGLSESPLMLRLSWKKSSHDSAHLIGVFELNLRQLLVENFVRREPETDDLIRLRFYHGHDDVIYIQVNLKGPALPVGRAR